MFAYLCRAPPEDAHQIHNACRYEPPIWAHLWISPFGAIQGGYYRF